MNILTLNLDNPIGWAFYNSTKVKKITSGEFTLRKATDEKAEEQYKRFKLFLDYFLSNNDTIDKIYIQNQDPNNKKIIKIIFDICKLNDIRYDEFDFKESTKTIMGDVDYDKKLFMDRVLTLGHTPDCEQEAQAISMLYRGLVKCCIKDLPKRLCVY